MTFVHIPCRMFTHISVFLAPGTAMPPGEIVLDTSSSFGESRVGLQFTTVLFLLSFIPSHARNRHSPISPSYAGGADRGRGHEHDAVLQSHLQKIVTDGDLIFGGLFPIHEESPHDSTSCGRIKLDKGVQRLEAMLYAVDLLNADPSILPGLTVGLHVLDTCGDDTFGLEQSMDFIKAHLSNVDVDDYSCKDMTPPIHHPLRPVAGVIGAANSPVSIMVANILRLFKVRHHFLHLTPCSRTLRKSRYHLPQVAQSIKSCYFIQSLWFRDSPASLSSKTLL